MYITKDNGPYKKGTVVMMEYSHAFQAGLEGWAVPYPEREKAIVQDRETR